MTTSTQKTNEPLQNSGVTTGGTVMKSNQITPRRSATALNVLAAGVLEYLGVHDRWPADTLFRLRGSEFSDLEIAILLSSGTATCADFIAESQVSEALLRHKRGTNPSALSSNTESARQ